METYMHAIDAYVWQQLLSTSFILSVQNDVIIFWRMADYSSWITVAQTKGSCIVLPSCQKATKKNEKNIQFRMERKKRRRRKGREIKIKVKLQKIIFVTHFSKVESWYSPRLLALIINLSRQIDRNDGSTKF